MPTTPTMPTTRSRFTPPPFGPRWLRSWMERHQHPFSFWIHMIGIPMTIVAIPVLFLYEWYWGVGLFLGGYALQFLGHAVEGNDAGEWCAVKKLLGLPYVAVSPRYQTSPASPPQACGR